MLFSSAGCIKLDKKTVSLNDFLNNYNEFFQLQKKSIRCALQKVFIIKSGTHCMKLLHLQKIIHRLIKGGLDQFRSCVFKQIIFWG